MTVKTDQPKFRVEKQEFQSGNICDNEALASNLIIIFSAEGLDFLKQGQAEEDQAFEGRSVNVNSNTVTESNNKNSYQHAGEKGGWGSEEQNDQKMVDQRLQRSGTDAKGIQDDEAEEDDDIPVIPTLGGFISIINSFTPL